MSEQTAIQFTQGPDGSAALVAGDWLLRTADTIEDHIQKSRRHKNQKTHLSSVDISGLQRLDTTGALILLNLLDDCRPEVLSEKFKGARQHHMNLLDAIATALQHESEPRRKKSKALRLLLERTGSWVIETWGQIKLLLHFIGVVIQTTFRNIIEPWRMRWTSLIYHLEHNGLDAVPIVSLLSFLVGAVLAFLGSSILRDFGAQVYTAEMVGYAFLREFGVLLPAILLAGRSGSAFTAQIGSMKSNEELDAMKTLGMDPVSVLVMPRLVGLIIAMPLLAFLSMLSGLLGGGVVASLLLNVSPGMFMERIVDNVGITNFWLGMIKAPVFAFLIAVVGCLEGIKVSGSAESVGRHTTSSVVQSIFLVIAADAFFAILFERLGL